MDIGEPGTEFGELDEELEGPSVVGMTEPDPEPVTLEKLADELETAGAVGVPTVGVEGQLRGAPPTIQSSKTDISATDMKPPLRGMRGVQRVAAAGVNLKWR